MGTQAIQIKSAITNQETLPLLSSDCLLFLRELHLRFYQQRDDLLNRRKQRQHEFSHGHLPNFLEETSYVRGGNWEVALAPPDLNDRRVEITGPPERKMMVNALNSGAKVFMADLEDSMSPTWHNVLDAHLNLRRAVVGELDFIDERGKAYAVRPGAATLVVRPRGWHLDEHGIDVDGNAISASLFDFGVYFYHNAKRLLAKGSGPYFYLPKLESHLEARLWNQVFCFSQEYLGLPHGTIRATILIETITAAFEREEILFELKDHASGLNAGRWDYIFSMIKRFAEHPQFILPDRAQVTMAVPFMQAYAQLIVRSCHLHKAHAIGGMSAFIPNRNDEVATVVALEEVRKDKHREVMAGFDGTWVAHPDLVPVALAVFSEQLGSEPHQKQVVCQDLQIGAAQLLPSQILGGQITEQGFRTNARIAIEYLSHWLGGRGAVAINNLMEDAATAEISRAQLWQWLHHKVSFADGRLITPSLYQDIRQQELSKLQKNDTGIEFDRAAKILDHIVLAEPFTDFLTSEAYGVLHPLDTTRREL